MPFNRAYRPTKSNCRFIGNYLIIPCVHRSWIALTSVPSGISTGSLVILAEHEQKFLCGKFTMRSSASDQWVAFFLNRSTVECPESNLETMTSTAAPLQRYCTLFLTLVKHLNIFSLSQRWLWTAGEIASVEFFLQNSVLLSNAKQFILSFLSL